MTECAWSREISQSCVTFFGAGTYTYIDTANGDAFTAEDRVLDPRCFVGVRVLAHGAFGVSVEVLRAHPAWRPKYEQKCTLTAVTAILAEQLRRDKQLDSKAWILMMICWDEYQALLNADAEGGGLAFAAEVTRTLGAWSAGGKSVHHMPASQTSREVCWMSCG